MVLCRGIKRRIVAVIVCAARTRVCEGGEVIVTGSDGGVNSGDPDIWRRFPSVCADAVAILSNSFILSVKLDAIPAKFADLCMTPSGQYRDKATL